MKTLVNLFVVLIIGVSLVYSHPNTCVVNLKAYYGIPQPLLYNENQTQILYPDPESGYLTIRKRDTVLLGCPGKGNYLRVSQFFFIFFC